MEETAKSIDWKTEKINWRSDETRRIIRKVKKKIGERIKKHVERTITNEYLRQIINIKIKVWSSGIAEKIVIKKRVIKKKNIGRVKKIKIKSWGRAKIKIKTIRVIKAKNSWVR